ncbi:MAG: adenylyl-sulfate kinase, partial [Gammaproteobacteria bacterium]
MKDENIVWHEHNLSKAERSQQKRQKPCILWYTGLSGSGKST